VIVSVWQDLETWNRWTQGELRKESEYEIQKILDTPTEHEKYNLGVEP
jgi:heme-degrading monooxygenase HmoA